MNKYVHSRLIALELLQCLAQATDIVLLELLIVILEALHLLFVLERELRDFLVVDA